MNWHPVRPRLGWRLRRTRRWRYWRPAVCLAGAGLAVGVWLRREPEVGWQDVLLVAAVFLWLFVAALIPRTD